MAVFARLSDLISANVNALLDGIENPERMLAQLVRDLEDGLTRARQQAARAIAAERRLQRDLQQHRAAVTHWREQARLALTQAREDLARRALACQIDAEDFVRVLEAQHGEARQVSSEVRAALFRLQRRLDDMRRRQRLCLARQQLARVRQDVQRWSGSATVEVGPLFARFERTHERLTAAQDEILAEIELAGDAGELDAELATLRTAGRVEEELRQMKQELARPDQG